MLVEDLGQFGEVGERAGQAIDLVDDDDVELASPHQVHQLLKAWTVHVAAGEATVVEAIGEQLPAFMGLRANIGLACLALGLERVKILFEAVLGGFAGVDGTAELLLLAHQSAPAD